MHRRHLLLTAIAAVFARAMPAQASYDSLRFAPSVWEEFKSRPVPVIFNFRASWSMTCQIKSELIADLRAQNPDYAGLTIIDVDWDTFGPAQLTSRLKVERHSTLLIMKEGREVARLVNQPYRRKLRAFFDLALAA